MSSKREHAVKDIIEILTDMSPPRPVFVSREPFDLDVVSLKLILEVLSDQTDAKVSFKVLTKNAII